MLAIHCYEDGFIPRMMKTLGKCGTVSSAPRQIRLISSPECQSRNTRFKDRFRSQQDKSYVHRPDDPGNGSYDGRRLYPKKYIAEKMLRVEADLRDMVARLAADLML